MYPLDGKVEVNCETFVRLHDVFAYDERGASCNGGRRLTDFFEFADTWIGMGFVLGGIALCVHSKTS